MAKAATLSVRISKATKIVWEGSAASITSENASGPFDILPMHANFLTLVKKHPISVKKSDGTEQKIETEQAVIVVEDNKVKIYLNI
jgi:F0F1-type ATP synthase epsilon subunit